MTATDITAESERELEEQLAHPDLAGPELEEPTRQPWMRVCDKLNDRGEVCGATFSEADFPDARNPQAKAASTYAAHVRFEHTPNTPRGRQRKRRGESDEDFAARMDARADAPSGDAAPRARRAAAPPAPTARADQYAQGLASLALMAYMAAPAFDDFDLDVCTRGAPVVAPPLAAIAEQHAAVAAALDLVLGGGAGSPYVALFMAALSVAAPIAAHHGVLPPEVGARFGVVIGVAEVPVRGAHAHTEESPPAAGDESAPDAGAMFRPPESADDVMAYLSSAPPTVLADLSGRMMGADGSIPVYAPPANHDAPEPAHAGAPA